MLPKGETMIIATDAASTINDIRSRVHGKRYKEEGAL